MNKDLDVLLDCISYQMDDPSALSQALLTIAKMCAGNDVMKNQLRASKGLGLIQNVLIFSRDSKVKESAMYCLGCAIEKNVFSQKELCSPSLFSILCKTLTASDLSEKAKNVSIFLTICLVANCDMGQFLVRKSGCLEKLLQLFVSTFPGDSASEAKGKDILGWVDNGDVTCGRVLWCTVTRALCMCVNNPQNVENQLICARVFPDAFRYLKSCFETEIVQPLTSFIALSVADSAANKEDVYQCQGLKTLLYALSSAVHEQKALENIICYMNVLDAAIMDNRRNAEVCGHLGIMGILWKLLKEWDMPLSNKVQLVMTLDHCMDRTERNQMEWVELGGVGLLVELLTQSADEELSNTVKCVLQKCISRGAVTSLQTPSVIGCASFGCSLREPDSSSAPDKSHTHDEVVKKLEALENQTNKRFEQLQAILTPHQNQTMQLAASEQPGRTQESHQTVSDGSGKTGNTESESTAKSDLLSEVTVEEAKQQDSSEVKNCKRRLLTEKKTAKGKSNEIESMPNYVLYRNKEFQQKRSGQNEGTGMLQEASPSGFNSANFSYKRGIRSQDNEEEKTEEEELEEEKVEEYETEEEAEEEEFDEKAEEDEEEEYEEENAEEKTSSVSGQWGFSTSNISAKPSDGSELWHKKDKQGKQFHAASKEFCGSGKIERQTKGKKPGYKTYLTSRISAKKMMSVTMAYQDGGIADLSKTCAATNTLKEKSRVSRHLPLDSYHISPKSCANSNLLQAAHEKWKKRRILQHENQKNNCRGLAMEQVLPNSTQNFKKPGPVPVRNSARSTKSQIDQNRCTLPVMPPPSPCQSEFDLELVAAAGFGRGQRVWAPNHQNEEFGSPAASRVATNNACQLKHFRSACAVKHNSACAVKHNSACSPKCSCNTSLVKHGNIACSNKNSNSACIPKCRDMTVDGRRTLPGKVGCLRRQLSISKSGSQQIWKLPERKTINTEGSKKKLNTFLNSTTAFDEDKERNRCPGCCAPCELGFPLLNSRTFNIALETSCHSCSIHRCMRQLERSFAATIKREAKAELGGPRNHLLRQEPEFGCRSERSKPQISEDVYEFSGSGDSVTISPPGDDFTDCENDHGIAPVPMWSKSTSPSKVRRVRIPYSRTEEENLLMGVAKLGKFWKQILYTYQFHPSRTAVDLMEKYKRMNDSSADDRQLSPSQFSSAVATRLRRHHLPLSMVEERRLRRGVRLHGYNWTAILNAYRFAKGRTAQELRDSWRSMHGARNKCFGSVR